MTGVQTCALPIYYEPQFGTKTDQYPTGLKKVVINKKTWEEVQIGRETKRKPLIQSVYKNPSLSQGEKIKSIQRIYKKYPDVPNLYETTGGKIKRDVNTYAPIAMDVGEIGRAHV